MQTGLPLSRVKYNKGRNGEYMTYRCLRFCENKGAKFLFNVYIPKSNGKTTEIDVIMITGKGLFVFESKNYSGWIFGNEENKTWCQTLPKGRGKSNKENFYNPIMQNRTHIKHLKALVGENVPMWSVITFSERCTLKKIFVKSNDVWVVKRNQIVDVVAGITGRISENLITDSDVEMIYEKLYPYTQIDESVKQKHIEDIRKTTR